MNTSNKVSGVKTIFVGKSIVVFMFDNEEQFKNNAKVFYRSIACDEWIFDVNASAFLIYSCEYESYDADKHELVVGGRVLGTVTRFIPDLDNPCLKVKCGDETLFKVFERLDCISLLITNCTIDISVEEWRFFNLILHKAFTVEEFCYKIYNEFLEGLDIFYNTKDSKKGDDRLFVSKLICAYFYTDIKANILKMYPITDLDYETALFSFDDEIEEELFILIDDTHYTSIDFIDKATIALLDSDFCINDNYINLDENTKSRVINGLIVCFDNLSEKNLIFNYENTFGKLRDSFRPKNAALRLALLQNEFDIYFLASLITFMTTEFNMYMFLVNGKRVYTFHQTFSDANAEVQVWCYFRFKRIFSDSADTEFIFSEECFNKLQSYFRYAFRVWLNKARLTFAWAKSLSFEDILRGDLNISFAETDDGTDRSAVLVKYTRHKSSNVQNDEADWRNLRR